jgi:hypothetical protein
MTYALVVGDTIQSLGPLPRSARRLDTGQWVMGLKDAALEQQQACGYFEVVRVAQPADTPTTTHDRSVTLVAGVPTETWTERPKTQAEIDAETAAINEAAIRQAVKDALADLSQIVTVMDNYLAIGSPTQAQVVTQVNRLSLASREMALDLRRVIRLVAGEVLDGTEGEGV